MPQKRNTIPQRQVPTSLDGDKQEIIKRTIYEFFHPKYESRYTALGYRFGLDGHERLTLEEAGILMNGITRERVRQLERDGLNWLGELFEKGLSQQVKLMPDVSQFIVEYRENLKQFSPAIIDEVLLSETELFFDTSPFDPSLLHLLASVFGFDTLRLDDGSEAYIITPINIERLDRLVKLVTDFLEKSVEAKTWREILLAVSKQNRSAKYQLSEVQLALELAPQVEPLDDETFQLKFEYLRSMEDRVYSLLYKRPDTSPVPSDEIVRLHNQEVLSLGRGPNSHNSIVNAMSRDERFKPIGRTGLWVLSKWDYAPEELFSVPELIKWVLVRAGEPISVDELHARFSKVREIDRVSLQAVLSQNYERFLPLLDGRIGLRENTPSNLIAMPSGREKSGLNSVILAFAVEQVFTKAGMLSMPTVELHRGICEVLPEYEKQRIWSQMMNDNPAFTRSGTRRNQIATFNPDFKKSIPALDLASMGDRGPFIERTIIDLLSKNGRMVLKSLCNKVAILCHIKSHNVYAHVSRLQNTNQVTKQEDNGTIYCDLVVEVPQQYVEALSRIKDRQIHADLARGLSNLTEDNVDLGLFILGRAFDVMSKRYFVELVKHSKIQSKKQGAISEADAQNSNKYNLSTRIDMLVANGHLEDKEPLHFLRKERNDPAHNIHSLQQRQEMMATASNYVGWYLEYIALFESRISQL